MPEEDKVVDTAVETPVEGNVEPAPTPSDSEDASIAAAQQDMRDAIATDGDTPQATGDGDVQTGSTADSTTIQVDAPQAGFVAQLREAGLEHDYADDAAAAKAFVELRKTLSQRDEYAKLGQAIAPEYQSFTQWKAEQQNAAQPQEESPAWNPPEVNQAWLSELQKPESEQDPVRAQAAREHMGYIQDKWSEYMQNPQQLVQELVMPEVQKYVSQREQEAQTRSEIQTIVDGNQELCTKYENELSQLVSQQGVPLQAAIVLMQQKEQIAKLQAGETQIPEAPPAAKAGIVQQAPVKSEDDEDASDNKEYTDIQAIQKAALKSAGYQVSPSGIG